MSAQWYLYKDGRQQGPFSLGDLYRQAEAGLFGPADLVWTGGMENWSRADQVKGLVSAPPTAPPGPPSTPQLGASPSHHGRAAGNYRAAPAPGRGKAVLTALIVVLAVVVLGGGYFVASNLWFDSVDVVIADLGDGVVTTGNDQGSGVVAQTASVTAGLWAPPISYNEKYIDFWLEMGVTLTDIQFLYDDFVAGIPKKGVVPYPPYSAAYVCAYSSGGMINDRETLPKVHLLTAEPLDSVLAFYKDQLQGYYHKEIDTDLHHFWQGDADDLYSDAMNGYIQSIYICSALYYEVYMMMMPEAQTLIMISYQPTI